LPICEAPLIWSFCLKWIFLGSLCVQVEESSKNRIELLSLLETRKRYDDAALAEESRTISSINDGQNTEVLLDNKHCHKEPFSLICSLQLFAAEYESR
jgi:hypothetical protein